MQLTQTQFKILILVIGVVIGLALSFMIYAVTNNPVSFIFVAIAVVIIYFQMVRPIGKKGNE